MTNNLLGFLFVVLFFFSGKWLGYAWRRQTFSEPSSDERRAVTFGRAIVSNVLAVGTFVLLLTYPRFLNSANLQGAGAVSALVLWGLSLLLGVREANRDRDKERSPGDD